MRRPHGTRPLPLHGAIAVVCALAPAALRAQGSTSLTLSNAQVKATVRLQDGRLIGESLETLPGWAASQGPGAALRHDGDFRVEVVWNDWQAPGKANNGDVMCAFTARDFKLDAQARRPVPGGEELSLTFKGPSFLGVEVVYTLASKAHYLRRKLRVFEYPHPQYARKGDRPTGHLLHALYAYDAGVEGQPKVVKAGGFGQPVALELDGGGAFAGLEWPTADNSFQAQGGGHRLRAGQEMGEPIGFDGIWGESAVLAVTPNAYVKDWFVRYFDDIRVAPLRPYTLYNSWYDLRSTEYPKVKPHQIMNEANILRIAKQVQDNMVKQHGITLDAFVLDDGWDVYKSAWELRKEEFPRGLAPIVDTLRATNTRLGIWYGPTGGYSFHGARADWFRQNGYEVTDSNMLSVVGPRYADLFQKRTTGMAQEGVAYFKWDGLQFVDNNPKNGGPIGIYSRRAALKHVIESARANRAVNPDMFLNITSGTWLSPWWMKVADQIWMDGGDFGEAEVPSISTRDSSITYRDMVLYDDLHTKDLWFPVSNLMTHGILKGHIDVENIGRGEPLRKFADEVVFYLARGVSMYELYIAPDILNAGEWNVLSESLKWARANFDVFKRGEMIGGDPGKSQAYGHVHFKGDKGFLALRNPGIQPAGLKVKLDPAQGLSPGAKDLVLERIYPTRWVSPALRRAGDVMEVPLQGYESAIYQLRPLGDVKEPLLAGVVWEPLANGSNGARMHELAVLEAGPDAGILNPQALRGLEVAGRRASAEALRQLKPTAAPYIRDTELKAEGDQLRASLTLDATSREATFGLLLRPDAAHQGGPLPSPTLQVDGLDRKPERVASEGGGWAWFTISLTPGRHEINLRFTAAPGAGGLRAPWSGSAQAWITGTQAVQPVIVTLRGNGAPGAPLMPPTGRGPLELPRTQKLGEAGLQIQ